MSRLFAGLIVVISLTACPSKAPENANDPRASVWGDQVKTLDKARGVEQTVNEAAFTRLRNAPVPRRHNRGNNCTFSACGICQLIPILICRNSNGISFGSTLGI